MKLNALKIIIVSFLLHGSLTHAMLPPLHPCENAKLTDIAYHQGRILCSSFIAAGCVTAGIIDAKRGLAGFRQPDRTLREHVYDAFLIGFGTIMIGAGFVHHWNTQHNTLAIECEDPK